MLTLCVCCEQPAHVPSHELCHHSAQGIHECSCASEPVEFTMHCTGKLLLLSAQEEGTCLSGLMPGVSHENVVLLKATPNLWLPM